MVDLERMQAAHELLKVSNADTQFKTIIPAMFAQMRTAIPVDPPERRIKMDEILDEVEAEFVHRYKEVTEQMAQLYARRFTTEEMIALAEFYHSPLGAKFISAMPELATDAMQLGNAWGERISNDAWQSIQQKIQLHGLVME